MASLEETTSSPALWKTQTPILLHTIDGSRLVSLALCFEQSTGYNILSQKEVLERKKATEELSRRIQDLESRSLRRTGLVHSLAEGCIAAGELDTWEQKEQHCDDQVSQLQDLKHQLLIVQEPFLKHVAAVLREAFTNRYSVGGEESTSPNKPQVASCDGPDVSAVGNKPRSSVNSISPSPETNIFQVDRHEMLHEKEGHSNYLRTLLGTLQGCNSIMHKLNARFNAEVLSHNEPAGLTPTPNIAVTDLLQSQVQYINSSLATLQIEENHMRERIKQIILQLRYLLGLDDHDCRVLSEFDVRGLLKHLEDHSSSLQLDLGALWQIVSEHSTNVDSGRPWVFNGEISSGSEGHSPNEEMSFIGPDKDMSRGLVFGRNTSEESVYEGDAFEDHSSHDVEQSKSVTDVAYQDAHGRFGLQSRIQDGGIEDVTMYSDSDSSSESVRTPESDVQTLSLVSLTNMVKPLLEHLKGQIQSVETHSNQRQEIRENDIQILKERLDGTLEDLDGLGQAYQELDDKHAKTEKELASARSRITQLTTEIADHAQKLQDAQNHAAEPSLFIESSAKDKYSIARAVRDREIVEGLRVGTTVAKALQECIGGPCTENYIKAQLDNLLTVLNEIIRRIGEWSEVDGNADVRT